jgi:hypothetical protein
MIERMYPGVHLAEVPFEAKPIDGVPTAQPGAGTPAWTDHNTHDPGITLLELFAFLSEPLLFRTDLGAPSSRWIGETEKNLSTRFDAAASSDATLHYDESASLFGKEP